MKERGWQIRNFFQGELRLSSFLKKILHRLLHLSSENLNLFATYDIIELSEQAGESRLIDDSVIAGIVVQGQIIRRTTFESCKFYKRVYPQVRIVLSTWEGEDVEQFQSLLDSHFKIVQSKRPVVAGPSNLNLQITSTNAGIKWLSDQGCTHILKTRTDILLGNSLFLNYLIWMQSKGKQNAIVFSSFNSFLFRLFSPSDQVMFGKVKDIERFWSVDLIPSGCEIDLPEKYLFKNYLESNGFKTVEEPTNYLTAIRDFTVIADHELLGQIWNKGTYTSLNYRWRGERFPNRMTQLSSWHWEMLQDNLDYFEDLYDSLD